MAKFNDRRQAVAARSPITTSPTPTALTHEGGPGYVRDAKSELFLLSVSNMVGEDTFYEKASDRDERFTSLVRKIAVEDFGWLAGFAPWLRGEANMRSSAVVMALEAVHARLAAGLHGGNRQLVDAVLQRADEPGEALAYWTSTYGRALPQPVKRGVADAVRRLYGEYALAKYDSDARGWRFGDVIDLVHPLASAPWQGDLFTHALDRRHGRDNPIGERLGMLRARAQLLALPVAERRQVLLAEDGPERLKAAGMTWEALAGWLQGPMDAAAWEAIIPSMGVFALTRNLRNFDEAGVSDKVAEQVAARLCDPKMVARSRMLPFRWWQAYHAVSSDRWAHPLSKALDAAVGNIPALDGQTLVLVDTSGSMQGRLSGRSDMMYVQAAALFGIALTLRGGSVDLYGFADGQFPHQVARGGSVLREMERFCARIGEVGHGTRIAEAVRRTYKGHHRVIILSDMQTFSNPWAGSTADQAPAHVPMYGFNLAGYRAGAIPSGIGTRHELGGLSDHTFSMIPLLEAGRAASWPWLRAAAA